MDAASLLDATEFSWDGNGTGTVNLSAAWWLTSSAHGGYLSAIALRSMISRLPDGGQRPLSLAAHFAGTVTPELAELKVRIDRHSAGGTTLSARLFQAGQCALVSTAVFGRVRTGPRVDSSVMPSVPAPGDCPIIKTRPEVLARFPLGHRFERRRLPAPSTGIAGEWDVGGWIRLSEPCPAGHLASVVFLDAWTAAASAKVGGRVRMSSLSYFVHFIADPPASPLDDPAYTLAVFRCNWARDGYAEDDGALWSADGQLLARSKQVVLVGN